MVPFPRLNYRVFLAAAMVFVAGLWFCDRATTAAPSAAYDPLRVPPGFVATTLDLNVVDASRQRTIPVRIYLGPNKTPAPLVLFSHGLGGSRQTNAFLGQHWAARNYIAVFLQHPGSDEAVWQGKPRAGIMAAMAQAASGENFQLRIKDVRVVLDQLERWNQEARHPLHQRLNPKSVGMSGHSFGAVTTQAVSGQTFPLVGAAFTDTRIKAACLFSPSTPAKSPRAMAADAPTTGGAPTVGGTATATDTAQAETAKRAFGAVKIPWLIMTGTRDTSPRQGVDVASRLAVFPALPAGRKYEVVLEGAQHSAFSSRALPGEGALGNRSAARNPNHHRAMLALTTAFWDAWLRDDESARKWLDEQGPSSILEKGDRWRKK